MREQYALKYQIYDPDTPIYMDKLPGENKDEYYKAIDDERHILVRRDTW